MLKIIEYKKRPNALNLFELFNYELFSYNYFNSNLLLFYKLGNNLLIIFIY